jgi:hypothetical protein
MQQSWHLSMARVPVAGEVVTFTAPDDADATDYFVTVVHWFGTDAASTVLEPHVSLRL